MLFSFYEVLLLIGIFQGLFTAVLLFLSDKNPLSSRLLAIGLVAFSLVCVKMVMISTDMMQTVEYRYFPLVTELSVAPLLYLYGCSLITPGFVLRAKMLWHFAPFLIMQCYALWVYLAVVSITPTAEKDVIANALYYQPIKKAEDILTLLLIAVYIGRTYLKLSEYRKKIAANTSDNRYATFRWLLRIIQLAIVLSLFMFLNLMADAVFNLNHITGIHWQSYLLYNAALIYFLGFKGYMQPEFEVPEVESLTKTDDVEKIPQTQMARLKERLEYLLYTEKVYLDPVLSAQQLAQLLDTSQSNLSYVLKTHFNKSFRELINDLRIEQTKARLLDEQSAKQSILSIALESGFNSEASFYRVFKKSTGVSPKAFIAAQKSCQ